MVADIGDIARGVRTMPFGRPVDKLANSQKAPMQRHEGGYYIRMIAVDKPGTAATIAKRLAQHDISMESIVQRHSGPPAGGAAWILARSGNSTRAATGRRGVAVLGFKNLATRPDVAWIATALAETVSVDLSGRGVRSISGEVVARARSDLQLADAESYAPETLAKVRDQLGAELVVVGSFLALSSDKTEALQINLRVQDTRTGETVAQATDTAGAPISPVLDTFSGVELIT